MKIIRRKHYLDQLYAYKNKPDIKIITGVRRCGKSFLMNQFIKEIKETEENFNIVRINFNDLDFAKLKEYSELNRYIMDKYIEGKTNYLFIDEVQMCNNFELVINSVHAKQIYDIYITGSNAFLLSSDLATLFTGRYMEIEVFPFSFKEYIEYYDYLNLDLYTLFDKYIEEGGFSSSYLYEENSLKYKNINNIISVIILRDIVRRNNVSDETTLDKITTFLMDNISNLTSSNKISDYFSSNGTKIDHKTVSNYLNYLCRSFVFYKVKRFDIKGKSYLKTNDKYYLVDHAIRIAKLGYRNFDYGRLYENIVAIELLRRGYEIYVGKLYQKEVDLIAIKGNEKIYIQVSDNIENRETLERELAPLRQIPDSYPKIIIANTRHDVYDVDGILIYDLARWLIK